MKLSTIKEGSKKLAIVGVAAGFLAAGLKTRQWAEGETVPSGSLADFSWRDWKHALVETKNALTNKSLSMLAAGVAYYSTLAFFPLLAAGVAIAALLITSQQIHELVSATEAYLPGDISKIIASQLQSLVSRRSDNFLAATIAVALALFSASGASKNLVIASNVAYNVKESRGWLVQQIWGMLWTVGGILLGFLFIGLLAINHTVLEHFGVPSFVVPLVLYGRWIVMVLLTVLGLAVFYHYGPNRPRARWQWASWGAVMATALWLVGTLLFFIYVQNFANYTKSYSVFAGIIILMVWLNLSSLAVLMGAEINHRLEEAGRKKAGFHT